MRHKAMHKVAQTLFISTQASVDCCKEARYLVRRPILMLYTITVFRSVSCKRERFDKYRELVATNSLNPF